MTGTTAANFTLPRKWTAATSAIPKASNRQIEAHTTGRRGPTAALQITGAAQAPAARPDHHGTVLFRFQGDPFAAIT